MLLLNNMDNLIEKIEQWSIDRNLDKADSAKQMLKVMEEVGEVASALAKGNVDELEDGIGDVVVTLIILAQQNNLYLQDCVYAAYQQIANRTGKTVNGIFIKD
jgi:NTP pyrophosphatase (non-canonical NTP hydrolase)